MNTPKLYFFVHGFNYELDDPDITKFFINLKLLILDNDCINENWYISCGNYGCQCHKGNNLLYNYFPQPKIIEKLLILGANPNTLLQKEKTTFNMIVERFIAEYKLCCGNERSIILLSKIYETVLHLLNYGGDLSKFPKSNPKNKKIGLKSFLLTYYDTFRFGFNRKYCFIFFVDFLKNIILKLDKKYLEDNTVRIIPFDLVQHCIFSFDLESFKQFQINENDLGDLKTECIQSIKNLRVDKFKISFYFNIAKILNDYDVVKEKLKNDIINNIAFEYDLNESNFMNLKKLI